MEFTLVALESAHIQDYIYGSNRLKDNVGASYLVAAVTEIWSFAILDALFPNALIRPDNPPEKRWLPHYPEIRVEVIYSGGGNFVALFRTEEDSKRFIRELSQRILCEAPGMHVIFNAQPYDPEKSLSCAVQEVIKGLKHERMYQPLNRGLMGLGVTAMCDATSQPAVFARWDDENGRTERISAEVVAKRKATGEANGFLLKNVPLSSSAEKCFVYPLDLDELGRTEGDRSYIGVVHVDGNGIGKKIRDIGKRYVKPEQNLEYIQAIRDFSQKTKDITREALGATLKKLIQAIDTKTMEIPARSNQPAIKLSPKDKNAPQGLHYLPFRPLISGGDDVTFVCDGRIAIEMAVTFVQFFEVIATQHGLDGLTASAGVSIVKTHYPIARAYTLAEELTDNAKLFRSQHIDAAKSTLNTQPKREADLPCVEDTRIEDDSQYQSGTSTLDWHYTPGGLYDELKKMRAREYDVKEGRLTLRPLFIQATHDPIRNWEFVEGIAREFQTCWGDNHSKAKALMMALREGEAAVGQFAVRYLDNNLKLPDEPDITSPPNEDEKYPALTASNGWREVNDFDKKEKPVIAWRSTYYDALELMDLYIPLLPVKDERGCSSD
jgi:hypothetical protein